MITKSANKSDVSGNSQSTFMTGDKRKSLLIEYEELSRERNGINPRLSRPTSTRMKTSPPMTKIGVLRTTSTPRAASGGRQNNQSRACRGVGQR